MTINGRGDYSNDEIFGGRRYPVSSPDPPGIGMGKKTGRALNLRYVLSMFERAHQALMMALLPGPVGVR